MHRQITIHWQTFDLGQTAVFVNLLDAGQGRFFGFMFDTQIRRRPDPGIPRHLLWANNTRSHLHGKAREMLRDVRSVMSDLQITVGEFSLTDVTGYEVIPIDDSMYQSCAKELFDLWQKAQEAKCQPLPPHWPLSGAKSLPDIE